MFGTAAQCTVGMREGLDLTGGLSPFCRSKDQTAERERSLQVRSTTGLFLEPVGQTEYVSSVTKMARCIEAHHSGPVSGVYSLKLLRSLQAKLLFNETLPSKPLRLVL